MKFSVNQADFFNSLQKIIGVIPAKTTIPILGNLLLRLESNSLEISATDLEISLRTSCPVKNGVDGALTVPARKFYELIRELPELPLVLEVDDQYHLKIETEKGLYKLIAESEDEFPEIAVEEADFEFFISSAKLERMIDKTSFAVSTDELRSTLMGVYMQVFANELRMVATDGHRLAKFVDKTFTGKDDVAPVILPIKALQLVLRNLPGGKADAGRQAGREEDERVKVSIGENHITFTCGQTKIYSKLIEGQFPNYERVIPIDNDLKMFVNKDLLAAAVKRVSIFANQFNHLIKFSISPSSLVIQAEDVEVGGEAQESLPVDYTGDALEIGYNAAYLLDILRHIDGSDVVFNLKDPGSAALISASEQSSEEDVIMLLMPIRLNDTL